MLTIRSCVPVELARPSRTGSGTLAVVVEAQRREHGATPSERDLLRVDLRDEELHARSRRTGAAAARRRRGSCTCSRLQPGLEARRVLRRQDHDLVLADRELRLDLRRRARRPSRPRPATAPGGIAAPATPSPSSALRRRAARVLLPVLDEARRGELVDARRTRRLRQRLHVLLLEHDRHRHHQREVLGRALVVVLHRQHGARAVAHQHHLRRVVEQLRAGAAT